MSESERSNRAGLAEGISAALRSLPESERTLLIVDDDAPLCQRLARAMERRGFVVATADSVTGGIAAATDQPPAFAVARGATAGFDHRAPSPRVDEFSPLFPDWHGSRKSQHARRHR